MLCLGREPTKTEHLGKEISLVRSQDSKTRDPSGEIFLLPDALFRPRAYKNRASGEKKFPQ